MRSNLSKSLFNRQDANSLQNDEYIDLPIDYKIIYMYNMLFL